MSKFELLTDEQKEVALFLIDYMEEDTDLDFVVLEGFAGTGKSFTLNRAVENHQGRVAMTAPTHKAVQVLRKSSEDPDRYVFGTIHSLLGLVQDVSDDGVVSYKPGGIEGRRMAGVKVLIVDEVSMLDPSLFDLILKYKKETSPKLRIIFTGDPLQIPPVGQKQSYVFTDEVLKDYKVKRMRLSKPMRQSQDNPILSLATAIREDIYGDVDVLGYVRDEEGKGIVKLNTDSLKFHNTIRELFGEDFEGNSDYAKVLAWTNSEVDRMNNLIRTFRLKDPHPPKIVVGDYLVADKPIMLKDSQDRWVPQITTSEEIVVDEVEEYDFNCTFHAHKNVNEICKEVATERGWDLTTANLLTIKTELYSGTPPKITDSIAVTMTFKVYLITGQVDRGDDIYQYQFKVIHEQSERELESTLQKLRRLASGAFNRKAAWRDFFAFENLFAQVKYNYALTVHKSQGSSYQNTVVILSNINKNTRLRNGEDTQTEERNRIKYVAFSRSKETLYITT